MQDHQRNRKHISHNRQTIFCSILFALNLIFKYKKESVAIFCYRLFALNPTKMIGQYTQSVLYFYQLFLHKLLWWFHSIWQKQGEIPRCIQDPWKTQHYKYQPVWNIIIQLCCIYFQLWTATTSRNWRSCTTGFFLLLLIACRS